METPDTVNDPDPDQVQQPETPAGEPPPDPKPDENGDDNGDSNNE